MIAIIRNNNLRNKPIGGIQYYTACAFLFEQNTSNAPIMRAEQRLCAVNTYIELPHANVSVESFVTGKCDTCAQCIDLELCLDGVVICNPVTPHMCATNHHGQQHCHKSQSFHII